MKQNIDSEYEVLKDIPKPVSLIYFLNEFYQSTKKNISLIITAKQISNKTILFSSKLVINLAN